MGEAMPSSKKEVDEFERELVDSRLYLMKIARNFTKKDSYVEDIVQSTMLKALTAREQFIPGTNIKAWLTTILKNLVYTEARRSWRSVEMPEGMAERIPCLPAAQSILELQDLVDALNCLNPEMRDTLLTVAALGEDYQAAADQLGIEIGTTKSRVFRAREALRLYFGEDAC